jgi:predicted ATPase/tetratricopeptide (TPR) repeat protein
VVVELPSRPRRSSFIQLESSAFVGRRAELAALAAAVRESRLVTLVGEGGVGKTRLAQRFALSERAGYEAAGGVWCCDLRDARDVDAMSSALCRALFIADESTAVGDAAVTAVGRALAARGRALVVLDNVEPVLPAGAEIILRWLDLAPLARFVVTSREPLFVLGEEVLDVRPLTLPASPGVEGDAMALFMARVRGREQGYLPSPDESAAIAELLRRVRGVPLAIELCASRFSGGEAGALFGLRSPRGGAAASSDAQAIAWSFAQLDPWERGLLAQASVFRGGFTLAAAERVIELPRAVPRRVDEVLRELLQKGLLHALRSDGEPRFGMCESIRGHAARALEEGAEASGASWRHAQHHLDRASGPLTDLPGTPVSATTREELVAERENLEAVLAFGASCGRGDLVLRAAIALDVISAGTGLSRAQLVCLDDALRSSGTLDPAMVGRALGVRAGALRALGRLDEAERDAAVALSLARRARASRQIIAMELAVGVARFQLGDLEKALACSQAAVAEARASGERRAEPMALQQVGGVLQALGDVAGARAHYEAALDLAVENGDEVAEARAAMGLGSYYPEMEDLIHAEASYDRGLLIARRLGMARNVRIVMGYLGVLHFDAGRTQEAERWLDNAARLSRAVGDPRVEGIFEGLRGAALATLDLLDEARGAFALSRELLRANAYFGAVVELHHGHLDLAEARAAHAEGETGRAWDLIDAAEARLDAAEEWDGDRAPLVLRSDDARIAVRTLRRALTTARYGAVTG